MNNARELLARDHKIVEFLKGVKSGINLQPKPKNLTLHFDEGYSKGREMACTLLNEYLVKCGDEEVPEQDVINFLVRTV